MVLRPACGFDKQKLDWFTDVFACRWAQGFVPEVYHIARCAERHFPTLSLATSKPWGRPSAFTSAKEERCSHLLWICLSWGCRNRSLIELASPRMLWKGRLKVEVLRRRVIRAVLSTSLFRSDSNSVVPFSAPYYIREISKKGLIWRI